jgi:hypothetical protein
VHCPASAAAAAAAACRFAEYRKDDPASFMLHSNLQYFPQFMFNLRRSQFVQVFGFGPDETAFFRLTLFKVPVLDAVVSCRRYGGASKMVFLRLSGHGQPADTAQRIAGTELGSAVVISIICGIGLCVASRSPCWMLWWMAWV